MNRNFHRYASAMTLEYQNEIAFLVSYISDEGLTKEKCFQHSLGNQKFKLRYIVKIDTYHSSHRPMLSVS